MTTAELEQRFDALKAQIAETLKPRTYTEIAVFESERSIYREALTMSKDGGWAVHSTGGGFPMPNPSIDEILEAWATAKDPHVRQLHRSYRGRQAQEGEDVLARLQEGEEKIASYIREHREELLKGLIGSMEEAFERLCSS